MTHPIQAFYRAIQNTQPDQRQLLRYLHESQKVFPHFQESLFNSYSQKAGGDSTAWAKCNLTAHLPKLQEAFHETLEREWRLEGEIFNELDGKIYQIACRQNGNRSIDTRGDLEWGKHNRFTDISRFFEAVGELVDVQMDETRDIRSLHPIYCYFSKAQSEAFQKRLERQIEVEVEAVFANLDKVGLLGTLERLQECLEGYYSCYGRHFTSILHHWQFEFLFRYNNSHQQTLWPVEAIEELQKVRQVCFGEVLRHCDFMLFTMVSRGLKYFLEQGSWDPTQMEILLKWPMRGLHYQLLFLSFPKENLDFASLSKRGPDLFKEYMEALHSKEDFDIRICREKIQDFIDKVREEDKLLELLRKLGLEGPFFNHYRGDFSQVRKCAKEELLTCIQDLRQEDQTLLRSLYAYDREDFADFINLAKILIVILEKNR